MFEKLVAGFFIVAVERAVSHGLRDLTSTGKFFFRKGGRPMWRGDRAAVLDGGRIVVFDFEIVATRLFEINRIGVMRLVRLRYAFNLVLCFVIGNVFVRLGD